MNNELYSSSESLIPTINIAKIAGFVLILVGGVVGIWTVYMVWLFFTAPDQIALLTYLTRTTFDINGTINDNRLSIEAPGIIAYAISIVLLHLCVRIVNAFVTLGGGLIRNK